MPKETRGNTAGAGAKEKASPVVRALIKQAYSAGVLKDAEPAEVGETIRAAYKRRKKRDLLVVLAMTPKKYAATVVTAIEEILAK